MKTVILKCYLKQCKYIQKDKNVIRHVTDNLESFSDDSDKQ